MKNVLFAALALVAATPAFAADFTGPRIEATAGVDDVKNVSDFNDVTYGAAVGLDANLFNLKNVVVGVEASVDNVFNKQREIAGSARLGYVVGDAALVYVKAGYANLSNALAGKTAEGVRVGGGVDVAVAGPFYVGAEYRYSDFGSNFGKHQGLVKVGVRF